MKTFYLGKEKKSALNKEAEILEAMMKKKEASAKSAMTSTRHGVHDFGLLVAAVLVLAALSFFAVQYSGIVSGPILLVTPAGVTGAYTVTQTPSGYDIVMNTTPAQNGSGAAVSIRGIESVPSGLQVKVDDYNAPTYVAVNTPVLAVRQELSFTSATIKLPKKGPVNVIVRCKDMDFTNFNCPSWEMTDIQFTDNGDSITFEVSGFSSYGGAWTSIWLPDPTPENNSIQSANYIYVNMTTNYTDDSYALVDFNRSLVGWWRFENNANDDSGNGNNGAWSGSQSYAGGKFGIAGVFNGVTSCVETNNAVIPTDSMTFTFWFNVDAIKTGDAYSNIIDGAYWNSGDPQIAVGGTGAPVPAVRSRLFVGGSGSTTISTDVIQPGVWYFGAYVANKTADALYVNGTLNDDGTFASYTYPQRKLTIGAWGDCQQRFFNGKIDDVMLFNRTLNGSEIAAIYNAQSAQYQNNFTGLAAGNYTFNGYVVDSAGNMNQSGPMRVMISTSSSCGVLDTANTVYTVSQDMAVSGTCFTVAANNVTLDCAGHTINYSQSSAGYGVYSNSYNQTVVRNCTIMQGSNGAVNSHGIYLLKSHNSTAHNNTIVIVNGSAGIRIDQSNGTNFSYNTVTVSGFNPRGVYLVSNSSSSNISYNTIAANGTASSGNNAPGIRAESGAAYNTFSWNTITASNASGHGIILTGILQNNISYNNVTVTGQAAGIRLDSGANFTTIRGNIVNSTYLSTGSQHSIYVLNGVVNNTVDGNTIYTYSPNHAIDLATYASNNTITANNITAFNYGGYGIYITSSSNYSHVSGNTINISDAAADGIRFEASSFNRARSNNITMMSGNGTASSHGIKVITGSHNNTVELNSISLLGLVNSGSAVYVSFSANATVSLNNITTRGPGNGIYNGVGSNYTDISSNTVTIYGNGSSALLVDNSTFGRANWNNLSVYGGNSSSNSFGAKVQTRASNATMSFNTVFINASVNTSSAIYLNSDNFTFANNTVNSTAYAGIVLSMYSSNYTNVANNTLNSTSSNTVVKFDTWSRFNTISYNTISALGSGSPIYLANSAMNSTIYGNRINKYNENAGIYFINDSNYNTVYGNFVNTYGNSSTGIQIENSSANNASYNTVSVYGGNSTSTSHGIYVKTNCVSNVIMSNTITAMGVGGNTGFGVFLSSQSNNTIVLNNTIVTQSSAALGIYVLKSGYNNLTNNTMTTNGSSSDGIKLEEGVLNRAVNNSINVSGSSASAFYLVNSSTSNVMENNTVVRAGGYGLRLSYSAPGYPHNNNFTGNTMQNIGTYHFQMASAGINGTCFIDQPVQNYSIADAGGTICVKSSAYGQIIFTRAVNGSGSNLSSDVAIGSNSAYFNDSNSGLNVPASIALYGLAINENPVILNNNAPCSTCQNTTSLHAANVWFSVAGGGSYSIGNTPGRYVRFTLQLTGVSGLVAMGTASETAASSLSNTSSTAPSRFYTSSSSGGQLTAMASTGQTPISLDFARSGSSMHTISVSQYLSGSSAIVAFTRGTAADVDRRAAGIADGSFFANFKPTFGYGLGMQNPIKILLNYSNINIYGNITLRSDQTVVVENLGNTGDIAKVKIRQS